MERWISWLAALTQTSNTNDAERGKIISSHFFNPTDIF